MNENQKISFSFFFLFSFLHDSSHRRKPAKQARPGHHRQPRGRARQRRGRGPALPGQRGRGREADGDAREPAGEAVLVSLASSLVLLLHFFIYLEVSLSLLGALDLGEASLLGGLLLQGLEGLGFLFGWLGREREMKNRERERERVECFRKVGVEKKKKKARRSLSTDEREKKKNYCIFSCPDSSPPSASP